MPDQATRLGLQGQPRLLGIAFHAFDLGQYQRRQLTRCQAFGTYLQGTGQGTAFPGVFRGGIPLLRQGQAARRDPGGLRRITGRLWQNLQGHRRSAQLNRLASARAVVEATGEGGAEGLGRQDQGAALQRMDGVAPFDHAMTDAVDVALIDVWRTQQVDPRVAGIGRGEHMVVVERYRVVEADGQDGFRLHIEPGAIHRGFQIDWLPRLALGGGGRHGDGQRLTVGTAQAECGNDEGAAGLGLQGHVPAGGYLLARRQAVLAHPEHLEVLLQRGEIGFAELGGIGGLENEFQGLVLAELTAFQASAEIRRLDEWREQRQGQQQWIGLHCSAFSSRCCC